MRESKSALSNARSKMQGWRSKVDEYKNYLQRKSDEIEESKKKMQNDCKRECGKGNFQRMLSNITTHCVLYDVLSSISFLSIFIHSIFSIH